MDHAQVDTGNQQSAGESNATAQNYETKTGEVVTTIRLADPWRRVLATAFDWIILIVIYAMIAIPLNLLTNIGMGTFQTEPQDIDSVLNAYSAGSIILSLILASIFIALVVILFIIVPTYVFKGSTIGKKILGMQYMHTSGRPAGAGDYAKRYSIVLVFIVLINVPCVIFLICCIWPILGIVNLIMLFTDEKNQTLYDKIAGTIITESQN